FMSMGENETDEYSPQAKFWDQFSARGYRNIDATVKVFMSMGENETDEYSPQAKFHDQFSARGYRNIDLTWHVFPDENHNTVVGPAVSRGLRALYAD
ncbi:MAG: hypothetical protein OXN87_04285, partial [Chloroflexota bacterium]|nr:hypothetical protein [Chloroflexota bacterium]